MTVIGLGHVAGVGKDVAGSALSRDLGFRRVAFADKLRELAMTTDPLVTSQTQSANVGVGRGRLQWVVRGMGWEEAKSVYPEVRKYLQDLGLGAREVFGEDFWVDQALGSVGDDEDVVVTDVRFENEARAIKEMGGFLVRIDRPGRHPHGHRSETELATFEDWDAVVLNDQGVVELETAIVKVAAEFAKVSEVDE